MQPTPPYKCYIINLDRAKERWESASQKFGALGLEIVRVPGVDGRALSPPYSNCYPWLYFLCYGRPCTPQKVACFSSHLKALEMFLETDEEYALICEDDVEPEPETLETIAAAFEYADCWDLLRLNAIKPTRGIKFATLFDEYSLVCDLKTASGNGAKLVNRRAAQLILSRSTPIRLPHDVTVYYDLPFGLREATVSPFPIRLNDFKNQSFIGAEPRKRGFWVLIVKAFITLPYRVVARSIRKIARYRQAFACWLRCRKRRFSSRCAAR